MCQSIHQYQDSTLAEFWLNYKTPVVRQLAFVLLSPNVINQIPHQLPIKHSFDLHSDQHWHNCFQQYIPRLQQLDAQPDELYRFLNQLKSTRLGLRFEMFIWFWLLDHQYHPYQLLSHSLQIIEGPKTIGELDFLIRNTETDQIEHWEVALKYYLGEQDLSLKCWYGLNRSDTLLKKLIHFTEKQFQFSHPLTYEIQKRFAVMKGQLFLPLYHSPQNLPTWVNTNRRLGFWGNFFPEQVSQFYRLNRHEWLCPNAEPSNTFNPWWTDGLYLNTHENKYYMYRNSVLLKNIFL